MAPSGAGRTGRLADVKPTRAGWALVVTTLLLVSAGRVFALTEAWVAAGISGGILLGSAIWMRLHREQVRVSREISPSRLTAGSPATVTLILEGRDEPRADPQDRPAFWPARPAGTPIQIVDRVGDDQRARVRVAAPLRGDRSDVRYRLPVIRRGILVLGPIEIICEDPFGLWIRRSAMGGRAEVVVLPAWQYLTPLPRPASRFASMSTSRRTDPLSSADPATIREYVPGDDVRRVHWPSTARMGTPIVRTYEDPTHGRLDISADTGADRHDPDSFERLVSAVTSLIQSARAAGWSVRLRTTSGLDTGLMTAERQFDAVLDLLAVIAPGADLARLGADASADTLGVHVVARAVDADSADLGRLRMVTLVADDSRPLDEQWTQRMATR